MPDARGRRHQKAVGYHRVDVRVEVEVFAKGVEGQEEGGAALGEIEGGTEGGGDGLLGDGAQAFEETAIAVESVSEEFGQGENVVTVVDGKQSMID